MESLHGLRSQQRNNRTRSSFIPRGAQRAFLDMNANPDYLDSDDDVNDELYALDPPLPPDNRPWRSPPGRRTRGRAGVLTAEREDSLRLLPRIYDSHARSGEKWSNTAVYGSHSSEVVNQIDSYYPTTVSGCPAFDWEAFHRQTISIPDESGFANLLERVLDEPENVRIAPPAQRSSPPGTDFEDWRYAQLDSHRGGHRTRFAQGACSSSAGRRIAGTPAPRPFTHRGRYPDSAAPPVTFRGHEDPWGSGNSYGIDALRSMEAEVARLEAKLELERQKVKQVKKEDIEQRQVAEQHPRREPELAIMGEGERKKIKREPELATVWDGECKAPRVEKTNNESDTVSRQEAVKLLDAELEQARREAGLDIDHMAAVAGGRISREVEKARKVYAAKQKKKKEEDAIHDAEIKKRIQEKGLYTTVSDAPDDFPSPERETAPPTTPGRRSARTKKNDAAAAAAAKKRSIAQQKKEEEEEDAIHDAKVKKRTQEKGLHTTVSDAPGDFPSPERDTAAPTTPGRRSARARPTRASLAGKNGDSAGNVRTGTKRRGSVKQEPRRRRSSAKREEQLAPPPTPSRRRKPSQLGIRPPPRPGK